jgi:hypothetical protein
MSAIVKCRKDYHIGRLRQELIERGYDIDYPCYTDMSSLVAVSSREVKACNKLKSLDEIYKDLEDLVYGFLEIAYINPEKANQRVMGF